VVATATTRLVQTLLYFATEGL